MIDKRDNITILPSRAGTGVDAAQVADALLKAAQSPQRSSPLPIKIISNPDFTTEDAEKLKIAGLVSKFTSLVAVDVTPSAPAGVTAKTRPLPVNLPAGWSHEKVFGALPSTATPALLLQLLGVLAPQFIDLGQQVEAVEATRPPEIREDHLAGQVRHS